MGIFGPEFRRHLWLKFSPFRLLAMPVILYAFIFIMINGEEDFLPHMMAQPLLMMYIVIVMIWGNLVAASAMKEEINNNTWDFQKMSSIGPWALSMGKLFGTTSYVWYFGIAILAVFAFSYICYEPPYMSGGFIIQSKAPDDPGQWTSITARETAGSIILLLLAGITGHALAFLISIQNTINKKPDFMMPFIMGLGASSVVFQIATQSFINNPQRQGSFDTVPEYYFFGHAVDSEFFLIWSILFFLYWIIAGIYRTMREELQYRNTPIVWLMFVASMAFYFAGLMPYHENLDALPITVAFLTTLAFTYMTVLVDSNNMPLYRRFLQGFKSRNFKMVAENTPKWFVTAILAFILLPVLLSTYEEFGVSQIAGNPTHFIFSLILLTARDGLVQHAILLGKFNRHGGFIIAFYYLMAYIILPMVVFKIYYSGAMDMVESMVDGETGPVSYFYPNSIKDAWSSLGPLAIQCFLAGIVLSLKVSGNRKSRLREDS